MAAANEKWIRGAGGGIGMSDHQNSFQYALPLGYGLLTEFPV